MKRSVKFGIDILLLQASSYQNKRIALVCNKASVTQTGLHSRIALQNAGFNLVRLFAPEHGFDTQGVDGAYIDHEIDPLTQLPIISLYSDKLSPHAKDLEDIDLIVIDLPDIGSRFYTYLWTMSYILESAALFSKSVLLLDRPNPQAHSLSLAEGPILQEDCASFIGRYPIPVTHQCTFGELAQYFKANYYPNLSLKVIPMQNWDRSTNDGYYFHPTSPAIQQRDTVYTYPGTCLFEGLNIHEGRETAYPFSQFGAPWIDADALYHVASARLHDAILQVVHFVSTTDVYPDQRCHGLRIIPKDPKSFQSFSYFIEMIQLINSLFPGKLTERNYLTNVNPSGTKHLDKLIGLPNAFELLQNNQIDTKKGIQEWQEDIKPFLIYNT